MGEVYETRSSAVASLVTSTEGARRILVVGYYDYDVSVRDVKSGLFLRQICRLSELPRCLKVRNA